MTRPNRTHSMNSAAALLLGIVFCAQVHAAPVDVSGGFVPQQAVLVQPSSFTVSEYTSSVAGTVTLSVQRIVWADLFSQLSTTVSLLDRDDLSFSGNALVMFDVAAGERFTTSVYALAAGPRGYGAYTLGISFVPQVPLPAAAWLLLSGLGALAAGSRHRKRAVLAPA